MRGIPPQYNDKSKGWEEDDTQLSEACRNQADGKDWPDELKALAASKHDSGQ